MMAIPSIELPVLCEALPVDTAVTTDLTPSICICRATVTAIFCATLYQ